LKSKKQKVPDTSYIEIYAKAEFRTEEGKKKQVDRLKTYYQELCSQYQIISSNVTFKETVEQKEYWVYKIIMIRKSIDIINRKDEIRRV
jgi:hypothetical protein